jgi:hypothetical protein
MVRELFVVSLLCSCPAFAATNAASDAAMNELEARKAAAQEEAAAPAEPVAAPEATAEVEAPEPAAPPPPAQPAAMNPKWSELNVGAQVVFAAASNHSALADLGGARLAGAFSIAGGDWVDVDRPEAGPALAELAKTTEAIKDVDPLEGDKVSKKKKELLEAITALEKLANLAARPAQKAAVLSGLATFKLALDPPYAYGHKPKRIAAWGAVGVGTMVTMAAAAALSNPLENERSSFGTIAAGVGLALAGSGAAVLYLDAN